MRNKILLLLMILCLLTGCSEKRPVEQPALPQTITDWPENVYTMQIPRPQNGVPDYVIDDSKNGRFSVFLMDITSEESEEYLEDLRHSGFRVTHSNGNEVSVGTILEKEEVFLSVSYSDGVLGLMISLQTE